MAAHRLLINLFVVAVHISGVGAWRCGGYKGRPGLRLTPLVISSIHMAESDTEPEVIPAPLPPLPLDAPLESGSGAMLITRGADGELQLVKPDGLDVSGLLTESQRRRLAPIKSLKRTRRSRKLRTPSERGDTKYVPLVAGARASTDEAILAAFNGDTLDAKREQGEDYYVDPLLLKDEIDRENAAGERRSKYKLKKDAYAPDKLKQELVAPYKNNVIGFIVIGIGVIAIVFAAFPSLLEENLASSVASFPDSL
ncbi:hypothetical protein Ctob_000122 [Chrysochromulina tobinii]|uniref:Uncharacterized protein n=1 Tax=Chrysochromulina tobinii TaxID=1460289 RepID=A0A0M0J2T6_9EUKA|nr:hypothetical protein Ctob_000122 [Chrysochromulina tobinii]|eukprot:KOO20856.1 hypothetical protein Ctob_000122 [Chrysochromulina sp. CCMP291]